MKDRDNLKLVKERILHDIIKVEEQIHRYDTQKHHLKKALFAVDFEISKSIRRGMGK